MATKIVLCVLILIGISNFSNGQDYTAAILEYTPTKDATLSEFENVLFNTNEYVRYVQQAKDKGVNIIVFPEYGLTTVNLPENLENISAIVPLNIAPGRSDVYAKHLVDLSNAAIEHNIYIVVNLIEKETNNATNVTLYYNTNVVFDKKGIVIARYRKINLFNEPRLTRGEDLVTFTTDFDVTFGLFTSYDILFKNPSVDLLLLGNVTDVIYTTAWSSETPFLQALSVQDGYAKAQGVNLIAAGYNNKTATIGGSGFYYAETATADTVLNTADLRNIVIHKVRITKSRQTNAVCTMNSTPSPRGLGTVPDVSTFETSAEDMQLYTFQSLPTDLQNFTETVCSENTNFCCTFSIQVNQTLSASNTVYKIAAFSGVRKLGALTMGVRACTLVACQNDQDSSCGAKSTGNNVTPNTQFQRVVVSGTFPRNDNSMYQPSTLTNSLATITGYAFCSNNEVQDEVTITMTMNKVLTDLFSFGIFGRVYHWDGQPVGRSGTSSLNISATFIVFLLTYLFVY